MRIIINGKDHDFPRSTITYTELVSISGMSGYPSVAYKTRRDGDSQRSGTMYMGQSVAIEPGMVFNVMHTSQA